MNDLFASEQARHASVLPLHLEDKDRVVIEDIVCAGISGGADYINDMPRCLVLIRFDQKGKEISRADYIQIPK